MPTVCTIFKSTRVDRDRSPPAPVQDPDLVSAGGDTRRGEAERHAPDRLAALRVEHGERVRDQPHRLRRRRAAREHHARRRGSGDHEQRRRGQDEARATAPAARQRARRREAIVEPGADDVVQPQGLVDVFQAVNAEVAKRHAGRQVVGDECARSFRHQDLAAVSRCADPSGSMHADAHVAVAARPSAHCCAIPSARALEPARAKRALPALAGPRRQPTPRARGREGAEQRVALRIDHPAAVRGNAARSSQACSDNTVSYSSRPSRLSSSVEPSMSVNRKVTVPLGRPSSGATPRFYSYSSRSSSRSSRSTSSAVL